MSFSIYKLYEDINLIKLSFEIIIFLWIFLTFMISLSYFTLFIIILFSFLVYYGILKYSLKGCDDLLVNEVLGKDIFNDENGLENDEYRMKVVAHRFACLDAPENSMVALENCYKAGCNAVEFDVAITSDNIMILFHDESLERLSGVPGIVSKMTYQQLSSVNISTNHPFRDQFQNARIAKFEDIVKKCLEYDMRMFIDIKDSKPEIIDGICKIYEKYPMMFRRAVVSSFNPWIIYQIRCRKPSIVGCLAWRPYYMSSQNYVPDNLASQQRRYSSPLVYYLYRIADCIFTWSYFNILHVLLGLSCVLVQKDTITKESIQYWRSRGIRCIAWSVNQPSEKQHFAKNLRITYLTDTMHAD